MVRYNRGTILNVGELRATKGVRSFGLPVLGGGESSLWTKGDTYHVDSGHTNARTTNSGSDPNNPLSTIDAAVAKCTANNGDIILVSPGHTETVNATAGLALDVAGITVMGLGSGNDRPTINFTTDTAADCEIGAADVRVINLIFKCSIDSQVEMLDINGLRAKVLGCEFIEGTTTTNPLTSIDINGGSANTCDDALIDSCIFYAPTAGPANAIELGEVQDNVTIRNCRIYGNWSDAGIQNPTSKVMTHLQLLDNDVINLNSGNHAIQLVSACTGVAFGNRMYSDAAATQFDPGSLKCANNVGVDAIDEAGFVMPNAVGDSGTNFLGADSSNNDASTTNVAANEDGSVLERLEQIQEATSKGAGTPVAAAKSLSDAIGFDGSAVVTATAGMLRTMAGTVFVVKKSLTSSAVVQAGVDVTGVSTIGDIEIEAVHCMTDGTGLAAGTLLTLETNNTKGKAVFLSEAVADLGANATEISYKGNAGTTDAGSFAPILETGRKVIAKCTSSDCTGAGVLDVYLVCRRLADNATLAAA